MRFTNSCRLLRAQRERQGDGKRPERAPAAQQIVRKQGGPRRKMGENGSRLLRFGRAAGYFHDVGEELNEKAVAKLCVVRLSPTVRGADLRDRRWSERRRHRQGSQHDPPHQERPRSGSAETGPIVSRPTQRQTQ